MRLNHIHGTRVKWLTVDFFVWYGPKPMTSTTDLFDGCRTHRQVDDAYHQGIYALQEAARLAHTRIVADRDGLAKRTPQNANEGPLDASQAVQRSHDSQVRRWATAQGIPFQRVSKKLREMYEEAHAHE